MALLVSKWLSFVVEDGVRSEEGRKGECWEVCVAPAPGSVGSPVLSNI